MSRWFRHYAGMMRDDKLVRIAIRSKQPIERVLWVWGAILESAAEIDDAGRYDFDVAEAAYFLRADELDIGAVVEALAAANHVAAGAVVKWGDRQFSSDRSAARQAAYRERKRAGQCGSDDGPASPDGGVTSPSRHRDAPDTETETEAKGDETSSSPPRKRGGVKPSRIAEDWKPAKPYPDDVRSIVEGWPDGLLERRLREFVDYWLSRGRDATKADWDRTWWNRIRDIDEHLAQKRGAEPPVEQPVDSLNFDKAAEPTLIADFRRRLALAVGAKTYKQWHDPLILAFAEGRLSVLALTSVAGDHVRNTHGTHFDRIARQVFGPNTQVAWTASKRKAAA